MKQHRMYHCHPQSELRIKNSSFETPVRVNNNLGIPILPLIKLVISNFGASEIDLVGDHKARLRLASNDHITQVPVVSFDIALTSAKRQSLQLVRIKDPGMARTTDLLKELPKTKTDHAIRGSSIWSTGITTRRDVSFRARYSDR